MAKKTHGLGRGLDSLFADQEDWGAGASTSIQEIPIGELDPNPDQPRKHFDEENIALLSESIRDQGVLQPLIVVAASNGRSRIIAGERRWRAAREAGLAEVPVRILEADDRLATELALVENLQREDLNPIEEARGYRTLMEDYGLTQEETARSVGRSRPAVANALRLLSLSPAVMELVEKRQLSAGHARAILPLPGEKQQLELAREVLKKSLTVRRTEQLVARMGKAGAAGGQKEDPLAVNYAAEVAEELSRLLGRKVRLLEARRGGRIELDYYDPEDRERLIEALRGLAGRKDK